MRSYFTHLRPFFFHLSPELHTPQFLRHTSPFLSSTLAYLCAAYIPELHDRVQPLHDHTLRLSDRVWSEGLKSLEIVQAYLLLIHWTPIENDWGDDRRWGWLGQALCVPPSLRLDHLRRVEPKLTRRRRRPQPHRDRDQAAQDDQHGDVRLLPLGDAPR